MNSQICAIQDKSPGINYYKGLHRKCKEKLGHERSARKEEIIRLRSYHRANLEEMEEAFREEYDRKYRERASRLELDYKGKEAGWKRKLIELEKELSLYREQVNGNGKSEKIDTSNGSLKKKRGKGSKGKKPGSRGFGRRAHSELPLIVEDHGLSIAERTCPSCGLVAEETAMTEDSEEVEYTVKVVRKRKRRKKYKKSCECPEQPMILTAPVPLKALTKSKYSDSFWIEVLLLKYEYQFPVNSFISQVADHGLKRVNASTLANGLDRIHCFLKPFYDEIVKHNKTANHWHCDDTRLAVFIEREGRKSFNWYLWQQTTSDTVVFELAPTRGAQSVQDYFFGLSGIISADRAAVFKTLDLIIAFCWVHVRRDFIKVGRYTKCSRTWALSWLRKIRKLYRLNSIRVKSKLNSSAFTEVDSRLRRTLAEMSDDFSAELANEDLPAARRKVLKSLENHWEGLTVFVDHVEVPMDNNTAERNFRKVAKLRKCSNGVFSEKFGHITAMMLTIFATLNRNKINSRRFLEDYFDAVARHGGNPPEGVADFLPWNSSLERKSLLQLCDRSGAPTSLGP
jgi:transposase